MKTDGLVFGLSIGIDLTNRECSLQICIHMNKDDSDSKKKK
ncbi:hypothetical protein HanRHA438_Chr16g0750351 [Helianthus annuus]|nr:hypothetical protein HanIR_Chr16g0802351 [Helianthus annuus]KAJ0835019.1 hypothetical protein HanRHA438_Chr16g0750351 [Helianthus annuus]